MICGILLAAGRSKRMGTQKLLLPFPGGKTLIEHVADRLLASPLSRLVVVVGGAEGDRRQVCAALSTRPVAIVVNPDADGEMLSSVRCGLAAMPSGFTAALVALGDQPSITPHLVSRLIDAFQASGRGIIVPVHGDKRGHPLLFSSKYFDEIAAGFGQTGLRGLLLAHEMDVFELPVSSDDLLTDMDVPADYRREFDRALSAPGGTSRSPRGANASGDC